MTKKENNALCHHGIKGQKWGIIKKDDSEETRLKAQKTQLNYEKSMNKQKLDYKATIALGRQNLIAALAQNRVKVKEAKEETKASLYETKMKGELAILAILAANGLAKNYLKRKG